MEPRGEDSTKLCAAQRLQTMVVPSVLARADGVEGRVVVFSSLELAQVLPQDMLHNHAIALTLEKQDIQDEECFIFWIKLPQKTCGSCCLQRCCWESVIHTAPSC